MTRSATLPTGPCWVSGLPDDRYHASASFSSTFLRALIARSPAHAKAALLDPREDTPALILGRAVHARVLEPDAYGARFAVAPPVDRRTRGGKAGWEAFTAAHPGAAILSESDGAVVDAIGASMQTHPLVPLLLRDGEAEVSGFYDDPDTGAPCRIRPDYLRVADRLVIDLKTTQDGSPKEFQRSIAKYGYHIQSAHYAAGFEAITGEALVDFVFICVEKTPPYAVGIYRLDDAALAEGERVRRRALNIAVRCLESGIWPGYSPAVEAIGIPAWAYTQETAE